MFSKEINKLILPMVLIFFVVSIGLNVHLYKESEKENLDFFKDYVIAINDYHIADGYFNIANLNLDLGNWYVQTERYSYDYAVDYYDEAKEQLTQSKELLIHSRSKLERIRDITPNEFYDREIENRLEQNEILLSLSNQYFLLNDYMIKQMNELLLDNQTEATRYNNLYNDLVVESNENLYDLSDISQEIDLDWDQDWYFITQRI